MKKFSVPYTNKVDSDVYKDFLSPYTHQIESVFLGIPDINNHNTQFCEEEKKKCIFFFKRNS